MMGSPSVVSQCEFSKEELLIPPCLIHSVRESAICGGDGQSAIDAFQPAITYSCQPDMHA